MESKKKAGRPKGVETTTPALRIEKPLWKAVSSTYKGKINQMFNEWAKSLILKSK